MNTFLKANTCVLPDFTSGYASANCNTEAGAITASNCSLSCADGYNGDNPEAECNEDAGQFGFSGCKAANALSSDTA